MRLDISLSWLVSADVAPPPSAQLAEVRRLIDAYAMQMDPVSVSA